jgi:predicted transcriptional regulator
LANLRNVIVHERREGKPIAVPSKAAVNLIEELEGYITKPPEVIPTFQRDVFVCSPEDPIAIAVEAMYKYKYSQIPIVQNGRFIKLLTTNTIANWLGSCITDEIFNIMETSIEEVCAYNENEDNCFIISRHASLFYLIDRFREYERKGKRLEAVLIT